MKHSRRSWWAWSMQEAERLHQLRHAHVVSAAHAAPLHCAVWPLLAAQTSQHACTQPQGGCCVPAPAAAAETAQCLRYRWRCMVWRWRDREGSSSWSTAAAGVRVGWWAVGVVVTLMVGQWCYVGGGSGRCGSWGSSWDLAAQGAGCKHVTAGWCMHVTAGWRTTMVACSPQAQPDQRWRPRSWCCRDLHSVLQLKAAGTDERLFSW